MWIWPSVVLHDDPYMHYAYYYYYACTPLEQPTTPSTVLLL
jgi:hypothetical protein